MPLSDRTLSFLGGSQRPTPTPQPGGGLSPKTMSILGPGQPQAEEPGFIERWAPTGARLAGPIAGGIAGGKAGALIGAAGGPIGAGAGAVIGAIGGGILGEIGAEKLEGRELDPVDIALAGGLSAVPALGPGRAAAKLAQEAARTGAKNLGQRALLHTAEGVLQGGLEGAARPIIKEQRAPTFEEVGTSALFGGALGGTLGTGLGYALTPRGPRTAIDDAVDRLNAEEAARAPQAPPVWQGDAPPIEMPDLGSRRDPAEVRADMMRAQGAPDIWGVPQGMKRPAFLDDVTTDIEPAGPELGYGRGGVPVEPRPAPAIPPVWEGQPPPEFDQGPVVMPRTPQEVAADMAELQAPRLQAEADEALLARVEAERAQPVSVRMPDWEGEAADAARMAREAAQAQPVTPVDPRAPVEGYRPPIARQPLEEPGVTFTETTPQPRDVDRRQTTVPTAAERRRTERRTALASELNLPPDHPAVQKIEAAEIEARTDPLTGLMNKRGWEELQSTITPDDHVIVLDMTRLKPVNDKLGHGAGDHAIRTFAGIVREVFGVDESARFGGDEMGALLRGMNRQQAEQLVETFRQRAANHPTTLRNPQTGETLDIPGFEAHIGVGKSFGEADEAANLAAAASRAGGRGDVPIVPPDVPGRSNDPGGTPPVPAVPSPPEPGLGARPTELTPPKPSKLFDREAALSRLNSRPAEALDLGGAAARGAGTLRDLAEIGASYIEDFARRNAGKIPPFEAWGRTVGTALRSTIQNVGRYLRQIYDEAVALWNKSGITFGSLPNEPKGFVMGSLGGALQPSGPSAPPMPPPKMPKEAKAPTPAVELPQPRVEAPTAPPPTTPPEPPTPPPMGEPKPVGEAPRVETKVEQLREAAPDVKLSRDAPRTWASLDKPIQAKLNDVLADEAKEAAFYERARSGKLNDVDVQALDALVSAKRERYNSARQEFLKAGNDPQANADYLKAALDQATTDLVVAARSDVEAGTKLGRALAARARVMRSAAIGENPDAMLRMILREIPDVSNEQAAQIVKVMHERPGDLADALHAALKPKALNKWLEAWKAGLVSAPGTQVANVAGNLMEQLLRVGETATAAAIDPLFGGGRTRLGGEAKYELGGALRGAAKSLGRLGQDLRDIVTLAPEKIDMAAGHLERQTGSIGGKTGRAIRIPFRLLQAFDTFTRGIGGEAELHKLAWRRSNGNKAEAERLISDPPEDLLAAMRTSGMERTFQNPNRIADSISRLRADHKWLHVVMPFVQTPANIASLTIQRSPAGFIESGKAYATWRKALQSGADPKEVARLKGEAVDKMARPLVGTMILGAFAGLAKAGLMTGSGPTDPKERNELRNSGWQPYSFKVGDTYVPYNRFEPVSSLLGFAADMVEAKDQKTAGDLADKALGSVIQNLTSKTYLQGLADAAAAINDPKQFAGQYVSNLAGSVVPNVVAKAAQAIDPAVRDVRPDSSGLASIPERMAKTVASRLPGVSKMLDQRRGGTGEPIERAGNAATRLLLPIQPSTEKEGAEFSKLLVDLEAVPSAPRQDVSVKGRKVRLTDEEYASIQAADEAATRELRKLTASQGFKRLDPERQKQIIENRYNKARADARNRVLKSTAFRGRVRQAPKEGA